MIQSILTRRFGAPSVVQRAGYLELNWNKDEEATKSVLFVDVCPDALSSPDIESLKHVYEGAVGGSLIGNALKMASLGGHRIYGLYTIEELRQQPEVRRALALDSAICFFLDAANVWFYGEKDGRLFVFDSVTGELDMLGPVAEALGHLIDEWIRAGKESGRR